MTSITQIISSADPLAYREGLWEITSGGRRWFGPDSLEACLEARPFVDSALRARTRAEIVATAARVELARVKLRQRRLRQEIANLEAAM
jgi:hypothetical protein